MSITKADMAAGLMAMANTTQKDAQVDAMAIYMVGEYAGATPEAKTELLTAMRKALCNQLLLIETTIKNIDLEMRIEPANETNGNPPYQP
jgi:hypothetical protein